MSGLICRKERERKQHQQQKQKLHLGETTAMVNKRKKMAASWSVNGWNSIT